MENATQAFKIAAGMLFAMLILGLLVGFYNNIRELKRYEQSLTVEEQAADFNKQYNIYNTNLYGSELLSLVNKAQNYNKIEAENKGYSRLDVFITFKNDIGGFKKGKTYSTDEIVNIINSLQDTIEEYGSKVYAGKTVKQLSLMRTKELKQFIEDERLNKTPDQTTKIEEDIRNYTQWKSDEITIKSKVFEYIKSSYDNNTGRIKQIEYKEQ